MTASGPALKRAGLLLGLLLTAGPPVLAQGARGENPAHGPLPLEDVSPLATAGAMAPNWAAGGGGGLLLSWLEPAEGGGHRLRLSRLDGGTWSEPVTIAAGPAFFANWADFPAVAQAADGSLLAHWLERNGTETYAYSVQLARSADGGRSWRPLGVLHQDSSPTEHGFVSLLPQGDGVRAFWLDGRALPGGGAMTLRTARVVGDRIEAEEALDERVCDCCQTGAVLTATGPAVLFRDRSSGEVRDIAIVRRQGEGWSPSRPVHTDGWRIPGCPVNGPVAVARGEELAVAWFTGVRPHPRVQVAFSGDGGASFGEPVVVDAGRPLGRVGMVGDGTGGVVVSWLVYLEGKDGNQGEVRLRRVSSGGRMGEAVAVATTSGSRASGFPRLTLHGERLYLAWVEVGEDRSTSRLRVTALPLAALPPP